MLSCSAHKAALMTEGSCTGSTMAQASTEHVQAPMDTLLTSIKKWWKGWQQDTKRRDRTKRRAHKHIQAGGYTRACTPSRGAHLVTQGLAVVAVEVSARQLPLMLGVQLLEALQRHDGLLADQVLGVAGQPRHSR